MTGCLIERMIVMHQLTKKDSDIYGLIKKGCIDFKEISNKLGISGKSLITSIERLNEIDTLNVDISLSMTGDLSGSSKLRKLSDKVKFLEYENMALKNNMTLTKFENYRLFLKCDKGHEFSVIKYTFDKQPICRVCASILPDYNYVDVLDSGKYMTLNEVAVTLGISTGTVAKMVEKGSILKPVMLRSNNSLLYFRQNIEELSQTESRSKISINDGDKLLTMSEVMSLFGKARGTIYDWITKGWLPQPVKIRGRIKGWKRSDIDKILEKDV